MGHPFERRLLKDYSSVTDVLSHSVAVHSLTLGSQLPCHDTEAADGEAQGLRK